MRVRAFTVSSGELFAHPATSLCATDYDNDAKRAKLVREANKLRTKAEQLSKRAEALTAQASTFTPNRTYMDTGVRKEERT